MFAINCCDYSSSVGVFIFVKLILRIMDVKFSFVKLSEYTIDLATDSKNVRIITNVKNSNEALWCLHCRFVVLLAQFYRWSKTSILVHATTNQQASWYKQQYPKAPITVVGDAGSKNISRCLRDAELAGQLRMVLLYKKFNRKMCDELVRDIGGVNTWNIQEQSVAVTKFSFMK